MVLICHLIFQDHVITGSLDFGQTSIKGSYHSAMCGGLRYSGSEDKKHLSLSHGL